LSVNKIKEQLIVICKASINTRIAFLRSAIAKTQEEANEYKGAMESRYDTFKEEAQYLKGGYEKHLETALSELSLLNQISPINLGSVQFGAIVKTLYRGKNGEIINVNYFIAASISNEPIEVQNEKYICISPPSPLSRALKGKEIGDLFVFRDKEIEIIEIF